MLKQKARQLKENNQLAIENVRSRALSPERKEPRSEAVARAACREASSGSKDRRPEFPLPIREYHRQMRIHPIFLQVSSGRSLQLEVTQKQEEPGGGIAKLRIRMRNDWWKAKKQIGGILRKKAGFMVRKVQKIRPMRQSYHQPLRQNGTDVQKDIFCT